MKTHAPDEWAAILEKLEPDEFEDVVREAMAQAFDEGYACAERVENIRIGYTTAVKALGGRAPKPSPGWDEPQNPYEGKSK